jgi:hypothetical protein
VKKKQKTTCAKKEERKKENWIDMVPRLDGWKTNVKK